MIVKRLPLVSLGSLAALVVVSALGASAAANTVPPSNAGQVSQALLISQIAPPECAGMGLTRLQIGGGGSGGGNALIIGTAGNDTLDGGGGDDCIVAGSGSDVLRGNGGDDVLISGPGFIDFLNGGGGQDTCYGKGFFNWPISCETYIP